MSSEHTEKASPRRKQKAEQEGDRPRSRELLSAAALLAGSLTLGWAARTWLPVWKGTYQESIALMVAPTLSADALSMSMRNMLVAGAAPCLFVMLAAAGASLAVAMAQNRGLRLQPAGIAPKWSRLNPAENAKHLFTTRALVRLGKSLIPVFLLGFQLVHFLAALSAMPAFSLTRLPEVFADGFDLLVNTAWIMLAWSLVDYVVEWRQWESRLKMSKQEMRDEFKETEGNPQMKGRIRSLQRQMRRRMLRADVRKASVVITNPTHYAVALSFDYEHDGGAQGTGEGPRSARRSRSGKRRAGRVCRWWRIRRLLGRFTVPSKPGQSIPAELYAAVAAILAYLFRQEAEERMRRMYEQQRRAHRRAARMHGLQMPWTFHYSGDAMSSSAVLTAPTANQASRANQNRTASPAWAHWLSSIREFALPGGAISIVFVMLIPLPSLFWICCWAFDRSLGDGVSYRQYRCARRSISRSSRRVLLLLTLFRLSLNIASSRRILLHGQRRHISGRQRDRILRAVCRWRQLCCGLCALSCADRDSVSGGEPWRGTYRGSDGAIHAGCAAGQTDGHRCRPECRHDR